MIKQLREEFASLHTEAGKLLTLAATEKRDLTGEEKTSNEARYARMDAIRAQIDALAKHASYALANGDAVTPELPQGKQQFDAEQNGKVTFDTVKFQSALNLYARTGQMNRDVFTITTATDSGVMLPKAVLPPVDIRRNANAWRKLLSAFNLPVIERQICASISLPVSDDSANEGEVLAQDASSGTELDPTLTGVTLDPTLHSSKQLWLSNTQVLAVDFDVQSYALPLLSQRIEKTREKAGATKAIALTPGKTTATTSGITYLELLDWEHSLGAAYRDDAGFVINDSLYRVLRGLVDDNNRPILDVDPTGTFVAKIHGKPVIVCDYMEAVGAGKVSGAFVSASAVKIMDVLNTRFVRYINIPSKPDQTGFAIFQNGDCGFVTAGIKTLKHAAA